MLNEKRIDPWAAVNGTPIALSTCDGSREPEVQAEPDDAQILYRFICSRIASPSTYSKLMFAVLGSLFSLLPFRIDWGMVVSKPFSSVPQILNPGIFFLHFFFCEFTGLAEGND